VGGVGFGFFGGVGPEGRVGCCGHVCGTVGMESENIDGS
jgi:hypothetical protein